jgi:hypothetical protein
MPIHKTIQVKAPKFEQYETVWLNWNSCILATQVLQRWLNLEDECWWYELRELSPRFPEDALTRREATCP